MCNGGNKQYIDPITIIIYPIISVPKSFRKQRRSGWFYPASCVPQNERFWLNRTSTPGPGRYSPGAPVACPCGSKSTPYSAEKQHLLDQLKHSNPNYSGAVGVVGVSCDSPYIRRIAGHGHSYVFRSLVTRLLAKPIISKSSSPPKKLIRNMEHDAKYLKMVRDPVRNVISLPTIDFRTQRFRVPTIRFNSIERPMKRTKLRNNKKVAFMSGTVRFPVEKTMFLPEEKEQTKAMKQSPNQPTIAAAAEKPSSINRLPPLERLQQLPLRYALTKRVLDKSDKMKNVFAKLPVGRVLVPDLDRLEGPSLDRINKPLKIEMFFKDEYLPNTDVIEANNNEAAEDMVKETIMIMSDKLSIIKE